MFAVYQHEVKPKNLSKDAALQEVVKMVNDTAKKAGDSEEYFISLETLKKYMTETIPIIRKLKYRVYIDAGECDYYVVPVTIQNE
jgi:hypothetical protein